MDYELTYNMFYIVSDSMNSFAQVCFFTRQKYTIFGIC